MATDHSGTNTERIDKIIVSFVKLETTVKILIGVLIFLLPILIVGVMGKQLSAIQALLTRKDG